MSRLAHDRYCAETDHQVRRLRSVVTSGADLSATVPTCPHRSLELLVRTRAAEHVDRAEQVDRSEVPGGAGPQATGDAAALDACRAESAEAVVAALRRAAPRCAAPRCAALREAGPDAGVWGWAGIPDAGFRARRTTHEITVHRADAALAAGLPYEVAPEVAADAVDEWLEIVRFVQRSARDEAAAEPRGPGRGIHLHATDAGPGLNAGWLIERRGARGAGGTGGAGAAGVLAPAGDVRLNRRFTADGPPPSVVRGTGRVCGR